MSICKKTCLYAAILLSATILVTSAQAAMVDTADILADTKRTELREKLQRAEVQAQLIELGVDPQSAIKRVDSMTDEEIAEINGQLETLPAGAGFTNMEVLLIVILLILLL